MSRLDIAQSHLEQLTMCYLGLDDVVVADDGELRWRDGSAGVAARVRSYGDGRAPHIRITAPVLLDVPLDPGLLEALNGHNARLSHARVWWADEQVIVGGELNTWSADAAAFSCLCQEVSGFVNEHASQLAGIFGGRSLFTADEGSA